MIDIQREIVNTLRVSSGIIMQLIGLLIAKFSFGFTEASIIGWFLVVTGFFFYFKKVTWIGSAPLALFWAFYMIREVLATKCSTLVLLPQDAMIFVGLFGGLSYITWVGITQQSIQFFWNVLRYTFFSAFTVLYLALLISVEINPPCGCPCYMIGFLVLIPFAITGFFFLAKRTTFLAGAVAFFLQIVTFIGVRSLAVFLSSLLVLITLILFINMTDNLTFLKPNKSGKS